jgi:hypothetical protein
MAQAEFAMSLLSRSLPPSPRGEGQALRGDRCATDNDSLGVNVSREDD